MFENVRVCACQNVCDWGGCASVNLQSVQSGQNGPKSPKTGRRSPKQAEEKSFSGPFGPVTGPGKQKKLDALISK